MKISDIGTTLGMIVTYFLILSFRRYKERARCCKEESQWHPLICNSVPFCSFPSSSVPVFRLVFLSPF